LRPQNERALDEQYTSGMLPPNNFLRGAALPPLSKNYSFNQPKID
jgi:hypothetical protein